MTRLYAKGGRSRRVFWKQLGDRQRIRRVFMGKIPDSKREDDVIGGALKMIEGKWKLPVMYILCKNGSLRYNELKRRLDITSMMLTSTLKELEADGLVSRIQYNEVPPRVEYSATKEGRRLVPAMKEIRMWGENLMGKAAEVDQRGMPLDAADREKKTGTIVKDPETGKERELPLWELIKGTWWCFGADGALKTGLIYDGDRQGWFYVDRKTGMKTGWVLVDGQWRYFEPMAHSVTGRMVAGTWIDGWYVDENGVWDGNERRVRSDENLSIYRG